MSYNNKWIISLLIGAQAITTLSWGAGAQQCISLFDLDIMNRNASSDQSLLSVMPDNSEPRSYSDLLARINSTSLVIPLPFVPVKSYFPLVKEAVEETGRYIYQGEFLQENSYRQTPLIDIRDFAWSVLSKPVLKNSIRGFSDNKRISDYSIDEKVLIGYLARIGSTNETPVEPGRTDITDWLNLVRKTKLVDKGYFKEGYPKEFFYRYADLIPLLARAVKSSIAAGVKLSTADVELITKIVRQQIEMKQERYKLIGDNRVNDPIVKGRNHVVDGLQDLILADKSSFRSSAAFTSLMTQLIEYLRLNEDQMIAQGIPVMPRNNVTQAHYIEPFNADTMAILLQRAMGFKTYSSDRRRGY